MRVYAITNFSVPSYQNKNKTPFQKKYLQDSFSFTGVDYFDYDATLQKKLDARSGWNKFWGRGKKKAKQETQLELIGFTKAQNIIAQEKDKQINLQKSLLAEKEEKLKAEKETTELYKQQLKAAEESNKKDSVIAELRTKLEASKQKAEIAQNDVNLQAQRVNKLQHEQDILVKREKGKGWDKIAGYEEFKREFEEAFINKIAEEKAGYDTSFPNGILFYGPHGTGKTRFAQAFAEQAGCKFIKINTMQPDDDVIDDLQNELRKSKKRYFSPETPKQRTVILLDDFDSIANLNDDEKELLKNKNFNFSDTNAGQLAKILSDCAEKYKATIFMTTNHPRNINSDLLKGDLIPYQVYLGAPKPLDAAKIFKYHLNDFTNEQIDYQKLGNEVAKAIQNDEGYSAQGIVDIVNYAKDNNQVSDEGLLDAISYVKPDISKKTFEDFLDDMNEIKHRFETPEEINENNA